MNYKYLLITVACSFLVITCSASEAAVLSKEKTFRKALPQPPLKVAALPQQAVELSKPDYDEDADRNSDYTYTESASFYVDTEVLEALHADDDDSGEPPVSRSNARFYYAGGNSDDESASLCIDTEVLDALHADDDAGENLVGRLYARPESAYINTVEINGVLEGLESTLPKHQVDPSMKASVDFSREQALREQERAVALRKAAFKSTMGKAGVLVVRDTTAKSSLLPADRTSVAPRFLPVDGLPGEHEKKVKPLPSPSALVSHRGSDKGGGSVRGTSKKHRQEEQSVVPAVVSAPTQAKQTTLTFTPDEKNDPQRRVKKAYNMCLLRLKPAQGYSIPQWPQILDDFRSHMLDRKAEGFLGDVDIEAEERDQTDWFFNGFIDYVKIMGYGIIGNE